MSYQGLTELSQNGFNMSFQHGNYWAVFVFYSSHTEQSHALSVRAAQQQLHPLLLECDPGYATGMIVEMHVGDTFSPQNAPEDRKGHFVTDADGNLVLIDRV